MLGQLGVQLGDGEETGPCYPVPSTQSSPINWKWGGDPLANFLLLSKTCTANANTWLSVSKQLGYPSHLPLHVCPHPGGRTKITTPPVCQAPGMLIRCVCMTKTRMVPYGRFYKRRPLCALVSFLWLFRLGVEAGKVSPFHFFLSQLIKISSHLFELDPRLFPFQKSASKTAFSFYLKNDLNGLIFNHFFM